MFNTAKDLFASTVIDTKTKVQNIHSVFVNVQRIYNLNLRSSIQSEMDAGILPQTGSLLYYTYFIVNGTLLYKLLEIYDQNNLMEPVVTNEVFEMFKALIIYIGKGVNARKFSHLINGKQVLLNVLDRDKASPRFSKIAEIWRRCHAVAVIQLPAETSSYEALSREYAMIKAAGLDNLTNAINSAPHGTMKKWNENEVVNFGNMLIYNALNVVVSEKPQLIYKEDVKIKKKSDRKHAKGNK